MAFLYSYSGKISLRTFLFLAFLVCLILPTLVFADVPGNSALQTVEQMFRNTTSTWTGVLRNAATRLFWILVAIDFAWAAIQLAMRQGDISDFAAVLVRQILFIGFFLWLLLNGETFALAIVNTFKTAAGSVQGLPISTGAGTVPTVSPNPTGLLEMGFNAFKTLLGTLSFFNSTGENIGLFLSAIVALILFAYMAANLLLVIVQGYITVYGGVILLGFGGSHFTKDITLKYFQLAFAVGMKIFLTMLVAILAFSMIITWTGGKNFTTLTADSEQSVWALIAVLFVFAILIKQIPEMVSDLITGYSYGTGQRMGDSLKGAVQQSARVAAGMATGGAGAVMAVSQAAKTGASSGRPSTAGKVGAAVGSLGKAAAADVGRTMSGQNYGGTMGGRMAGDIQSQRLSGGGGSSGGGGGGASESYRSGVNPQVVSANDNKKQTSSAASTSSGGSGGSGGGGSQASSASNKSSDSQTSTAEHANDNKPPKPKGGDSLKSVPSSQSQSDSTASSSGSNDGSKKSSISQGEEMSKQRKTPDRQQELKDFKDSLKTDSTRIKLSSNENELD